MALFGSKKKKETKAETTAVTARDENRDTVRDLTTVLKHPRITEKASMHQGMGVYTFDISATATKRDILQAVKKHYGVIPRKVAVVTVRPKSARSMRSGKTGVKKGGRKAYVYLKQGDSIAF
jgi:ribosomal protein L23